MICRLCNNKFYIKRTILTLFSQKNEYICDSCYRKYPIKLDISNIFLGDYNLMIISLFNKNYRIDYNVFYKEYSKIYFTCMKNKSYLTLFFNNIYLNDYFIEHVNNIAKLNDSNIIILCFSVKK